MYYVYYLQCIFPLQIYGMNVQNRDKVALFEVHVVRLGNPLATRIPWGRWLHKTENLPFVHSKRTAVITATAQ